MERIQCFMLEPTTRTERKLRRFRGSSDGEPKCPSGWGYHNGHTAFGEGTYHYETDGDGDKTIRWDDDHEDPPHDDPRWPIKCDDCPYVFVPEDHWQVFREVIYVRKDTGATMTLRDCPPGAMWDAFWYPEKGSDGRSLCVSLPPGGGLDYWCIDAPSKGGGGWTRSGEPPIVTANPSILTPRYHGFLRAGWLESC
jgi:hypothetical protein